jgi:hypothetical protein
MQKRSIILLCVVVLMLCVTQTFAEYDQALVSKAMGSNMANLLEVKKAARAGNFFMVAEKLMEIAKTIKSLDAVTPLKGTKEDWDRMHKTVIKTVFKAIGACGEGDIEKLNTSLDEIGALIQKGHGMFIK